jgi:hypothetical protein
MTLVPDHDYREVKGIANIFVITGPDPVIHLFARLMKFDGCPDQVRA